MPKHIASVICKCTKIKYKRECEHTDNRFKDTFEGTLMYIWNKFHSSLLAAGFFSKSH